MIRIEKFDDPDDASRAFATAEKLALDSRDGDQVVLLSAESEDVLRLTHPHYFESSHPASDDEYARV